MRFLISLLLLLPFSLVAQDGWAVHRSAEGKFSILTKGTFKQATFNATTEIGDIKMYGFSYPETPKPTDMIYTIMYYDFPKGSIHSDSTELANDFFAETVASAQESTAGTVIYQNNIEISGYRGKQWRINYADDKMSINSRLYLVENRCFILNVISPSDSQMNADTNHYFNSFRLLGW